jgi:translation initiation factor IF-3
MRKQICFRLSVAGSREIVTIATLIAVKEIQMNQSIRKKNAVRMLEQAVRLASRNAGLRMSVMATGRLVADLHKLVAKLERLATDDPNDTEFWEMLQKTISKLAKCLRQVNR